MVCPGRISLHSRAIFSNSYHNQKVSQAFDLLDSILLFLIFSRLFINFVIYLDFAFYIFSYVSVFSQIQHEATIRRFCSNTLDQFPQVYALHLSKTPRSELDRWNWVIVLFAHQSYRFKILYEMRRVTSDLFLLYWSSHCSLLLTLRVYGVCLLGIVCIVSRCCWVLALCTITFFA